MFCPKGYVPLSVVMRKRPVVANSLASKGNAAIEKRRAETEGLVTHFKRSSLDQLEGQLFLRLKEKLFLASPSGEVLKLDPWPFMRQLVMGTISATALEKLPATLQVALRSTGKLYDVNNQEYQRNFEILKSSRRTERFQDFDFYLSLDQKFGYHNLLIERYGYTISLRYWVEVQKIGLPETAGIETIFDCFKHHEGWSLCVSESTFLNEQQEIWSERKRDPSQDELQVLSGTIEISMATERRVAKLIIQEFDVDDQITKEIAKNRFAVGLGARAFQRAWEQARSERPALGKAGKPKSKPRIDT